MRLAGLTGGIGSGKTTVAAGLAKRGATIVDADLVAREVVTPGKPAYALVIERFGPTVVRTDGTLDRAVLGAIVFADAAALGDLNAIMHPVIGAEIIRRCEALRSSREVVVLDIALLDAGSVTAYGIVALLVVDVDEEIAINRLVEGRGFTEEAARARIAAQIDRRQRRELVGLVADGLVIDNSGQRAALETQIDQAWQLLNSLRT